MDRYDDPTFTPALPVIWDGANEAPDAGVDLWAGWSPDEMLDVARKPDGTPA